MKLLYLHGFTASGQCEIANELRSCLDGIAEVIAPDLPLYPEDAMELVRNICEEQNPEIVVGSSCGAFYAQMLADGQRQIILVNPFFTMSEFLEPRIGKRSYKSRRLDGRQEFEVTEDLIGHFKEMESRQFDKYDPANKPSVYGLFGTKDDLAHFRSTYDRYYANAREFDGHHTMTRQNVRESLVPLILDIAVYPDAAALWERSVKATHCFLKEEDLEFYKSRIRDYLKSVRIYAEWASDGSMSAFMGVSQDAIEMLFTDPRHFREGLGRRLVKKALSHGLRKVDVNEQNASALRFYEAMGFSIAYRDSTDSEGRPYPILHLEKRELQPQS